MHKTKISGQTVRWPGYVLLVVLSGAFNFVELEFFAGGRWLLGPFISLPLILVSRWPLAVATAVVPYLLSGVAADEPVRALLVLGESVALAGLWNRSGRLLAKRWIFYWVAVAAPLAWWVETQVLLWPHALSAAMILTQTLNHGAAVLAAPFMLRMRWFRHWMALIPFSTVRLRAQVLMNVFVLAAVPLILSMVGFAVIGQRSARRDNERLLLDNAERISRELRAVLQVHLDNLDVVAGTLHRSPNSVAIVLGEVHRAHPEFITMLITDRLGRITQTAPARMRGRLAGMSVADRAYFTGARDTLKQQISEVFRGRGFGHDILVALSRPIVTVRNSFAGIVQGSIEITRFRDVLDESATGDVDYVVFDRRHRVVFASSASTWTPLCNAAGSELEPLIRRSERGDSRGEVVDGMRQSGRERMYAFAVRDEVTGFTVVAQRPVLAVLYENGWVYGWLLLVLAGGLVTAGVVSRYTGLRLADPLERFSREAARQAAGGELAAIAPPTRRETPHEVIMVYDAFNQLATQLRQSYDALLQTNQLLDRRVTERTRELDVALQAAETANRSKSRFLVMTSHEIRTPLNAILGLTETLIEEHGSRSEDAGLCQRLKAVHQSGNVLLSFVNDLLDLSAVEAGKLELHLAPVNPGKLVREVEMLFADRARMKGLGLRVELPAETNWQVLTDVRRVRQVLMNLLGNAIKFTDRGEVTLKLESRMEPDGRRWLRFAVRDTGPGIAKERQDLLSEEFYRVEEQREKPGTGLGLAISRRLVALLGGERDMWSELGQGSEFGFFFSAEVATDDQTPTEPTIPSADRRTEEGKLRVLAADDNPINLEVLRARLRGRCETLVIVGGGREAIERLQEQAFDIALIDLEMPDVDGFAVVAAMRDGSLPRAASCYAIAVSAHMRDERWPSCRAAGFDDYVEKPINRQRLDAALRRERED